QQAVARVVRHAPTLVSRLVAATGVDAAAVDGALRTALMRLSTAEPGAAAAEPSPPLPAPPAATAGALRDLRDRISVPRDMGLHAARALRTALEATACQDPVDPGASGPPLPQQHRRDQDPAPFLHPA
ncbi:MAG: hypothetical protein VKM92_01725, partial [Cyanobacteriota bacterium]|nr:hypothetical protein [Cyanobacteriota bacterium]